MNEHTLLENLKNNSKSELNGLEYNDLEKLLRTTVAAIDSVLVNGDALEVEDFGEFSRRKQSSFFKPTERLNERINESK